jgi:hypothetical protein
MTLAEKGCGPDHGLVEGGAHHVTRDELRAHLRALLAPVVCAALESQLAEKWASQL